MPPLVVNSNSSQVHVDDASTTAPASATATATATGSSSSIRARPVLPQPSFAPLKLNRIAPSPPPMSGTVTPTSSLYTCPVKHLSLRLASSVSTAYLCRSDPATSFYIYLPSSHPVSRRWMGDVPETQNGQGEWDGYGEFKVVVLVHGSVRDAERLRNSWAERAEKEGVVIVAPLWAGTLDFPDGSNAYKYMIHPSQTAPQGVRKRYDLVLFDILQQLKDDWGFVEIEKFGLAGFSGGGQFVHRLLYLWPERIAAVSIGAPGGSTLIAQKPWPNGTLDTETLFGTKVDPVRINKAYIQILIGSEDNYHPVLDDGTPFHLSRYDIAVELHENFTKHGIGHEWSIVEGGWHETDLYRPQVQDFILRHLCGSEGEY